MLRFEVEGRGFFREVHPYMQECGEGHGGGHPCERTKDRRRGSVRVLLPGDGQSAERIPLFLPRGVGTPRGQRVDPGGLRLPPPWGRPAHDSQHLHLAVQIDFEEARTSSGLERPQPAAHRRQPDDLRRGGCGYGFRAAGALASFYYTGHLYSCF